jgi:PAS domain S-box-containing protein
LKARRKNKKAHIDKFPGRVAGNDLNDSNIAQKYLETAGSAIVSVDGKGIVLEYNRAGAEMIGINGSEMIGKPFMKMMTPESAARALSMIKRLAKIGRSQGSEYQVLRKDKSVMDVIINSTALKDKKGRLIRVISVLEDITERKFIEKALKESEEKYRTLFESLTDAVFVHQPLKNKKPGPFIAVNKIACDRMGYTEKELKKMTIMDINATETRANPVRTSKQIFKDGKISIETLHMAKDGRKIPVEINARLFKLLGKPTIISSARDITDRKRAAEKEEFTSRMNALRADIWEIIAEKDLKEDSLIQRLIDRLGPELNVSRVSYNRIIAGNQVCVLEWRAKGVKSTIGVKMSQDLLSFVMKDKFYDISMKNAAEVMPKFLKPAARAFAGLLSKAFNIESIGIIPYYIEGRPEGSITFDVNKDQIVKPVWDSRKKEVLLEIVNIMAQNMAKRRAERATEESQKLYRELFNNANDAIVIQEITSAPGRQPKIRLLDFNDMTCRMFEMDRDGLAATSFEEIFGEHGVRRLRQIAAGDAPGRTIDASMEMKTKKGKKITGEVRVSVFNLGPKKILFAVVRDISERIKAEEALRESEEKYRELFNNANDGIYINELDGKGRVRGFIEMNGMARKLTGYSREEFAKMTPRDLITPEYLHTYPLIGKSLAEYGKAKYEQEIYHKKGSRLMVENNSQKFALKGRPVVLTVMRDITERKRFEEALKESEEKYRTVISQTGQLVYDYNVQSGIMRWGGAIKEITGYSEEEFNREVSRDIWGERIHPEDRTLTYGLFEKAQDACGKFSAEYRFACKDGSYRYISDEGIFIRGDEGRAIRMLGVMKDITERRKTDEAIKESEEKFRTLSEQSSLSITIIQDGRFKYFNKAFLEMTGFNSGEMAAMPESEYEKHIYPEDAAVLAHQAGWRGQIGVLNSYQFRIIGGTGKIKWMDVYSKNVPYEGKPANFITMSDITDLKDTEEKLKKTILELERSNAELERFAYVASHDLQEPLRMISSYVQLLERRYRDKLGGDANEFIGYAVDGAARMQKLIKDLLAYSRLGTREKQFVQIDTNATIEQVKANLVEMIAGKSCEIKTGKLPEITADESQITQLFQNLISNGMKFGRKDEKCVIEVSAEKKGKEWEFCFKDNGIGIDPKYYDKIFVIFQRLHSAAEYSGTGIGLAICKRVVENHGGRIWVESEEGRGSAFYFTIPERKP